MFDLVVGEDLALRDRVPSGGRLAVRDGTMRAVGVGAFPPARTGEWRRAASSCFPGGDDGRVHAGSAAGPAMRSDSHA